MIRALVVCPGRGSYGAGQLGSLPKANPLLAALDTYRRSLGRPTLSELDGAARFSPQLHLAGEHASLLTFAVSALDLAALDPGKVEVSAVAGNSMGWYGALYAAGALDLAAAARLVETLGAYQAGAVVGGQVIYPLVDEEWRLSPDLLDAAQKALALPEVFVSIRLGGSMVFGASEAGLPALVEALPPLRRGTREYPQRLPLHSAFHTPLMAGTAARAQLDLADLPLRVPALSLVAGDGRMHRPWVSTDTLWQYTLGPQITAPYDFTAAIATALGEFGPDSIVLLGPGDTLGAPVAQILISLGWRGIRDRTDFAEAQRGERPPLLSMARPEQRGRLIAGPDSRSSHPR